MVCVCIDSVLLMTGWPGSRRPAGSGAGQNGLLLWFMTQSRFVGNRPEGVSFHALDELKIRLPGGAEAKVLVI